MVTLLFIRHAEAEGNAEHRFIGQLDVPLTALGRRQVERLTPRLIARRPTRIVSSDLQRCLDTIRPTAHALDLEVHQDARFREIENGDWGGLLAEEIEAGWPEMFARYRDGEDVVRPGGETWATVAARVNEAVTEVVETSDDDDVVVIGTHAGPTLAAVRTAAGNAIDGNVFRGHFTGVGNTSISALSIPGPRILTFNDTGHLEGL